MGVAQMVAERGSEVFCLSGPGLGNLGLVLGGREVSQFYSQLFLLSCGCGVSFGTSFDRRHFVIKF